MPLHPYSPDRIGSDALFDTFIDQLILGPEELAAARYLATMVAAALRKGMGPGVAPQDRSDHLVTGAVGKRTAIRPLSTIDLLYVLPAQAVEPALLQRMGGLLQEALPSAGIRPSDGRLLVDLGTAQVAVSPAMERQGAFIMSTADGWVGSNPVAEMAALRLSDGISAGRTTRLLALLKAWKAACSVQVGSFALEVLVREFTAECHPIGWTAALSDFFAWARRRTPRSFDLPGGTGCLTIGDGWHPSAESAYWRCVLAARHTAAGDHDDALSEWRQLLGRHFATDQGDRRHG